MSDTYLGPDPVYVTGILTVTESARMTKGATVIGEVIVSADWSGDGLTVNPAAGVFILGPQFRNVSLGPALYTDARITRLSGPESTETSSVVDGQMTLLFAPTSWQDGVSTPSLGNITFRTNGPGYLGTLPDDGGSDSQIVIFEVPYTGDEKATGGEILYLYPEGFAEFRHYRKGSTLGHGSVVTMRPYQADKPYWPLAPYPAMDLRYDGLAFGDTDHAPDTGIRKIASKVLEVIGSALRLPRTTGSLPTASASREGEIRYRRLSSGLGHFYGCVKTATGYSWKTL